MHKPNINVPNKLKPVQLQCGAPNREARLVGGEYLTGHEFPWTASIQVNVDGNASSLPATLITPKYLLTSANNVIGKTPLQVKIIVGQIDRCFPDITSSTMSVDRIVIHPDYNPASKAHDIALLRLSTPVVIDRRVSPICLPSTNYEYTSQVGIVYGWSVADNSSCRARKLALPILKEQDCVKGVREAQYITNDKGCLGVIGSINPICENDSGTAVMHKSKTGIYDLVGILGDKNDCEGIGVALYADVKANLHWILENTKDYCNCRKLNLPVSITSLRLF
ncbi:haptoglobin-related protein-like [Diorhabda carinulata]|uniref:haptoglobin-related protein-like n=1 Tax=Diorhabda carinulata TaxID=1163345 RepID=UPI0025A3000B|nr:haptoglobin-related protein-like [Diorhabda carinulata]